jgi:hypothetical protein
MIHSAICNLQLSTIYPCPRGSESLSMCPFWARRLTRSCGGTTIACFGVQSCRYAMDLSRCWYDIFLSLYADADQKKERSYWLCWSGMHITTKHLRTWLGRRQNISLPFPQGVYTEGVIDLSLQRRAGSGLNIIITFGRTSYHKVAPYVRLGAGDLRSGV